MFTEGIFPIGDGLLDIDDKRLQGLLVPDDINEIYEVEQTPFARGKFAAVRRAIHKHSGAHFAAKFLKRRRRAQSSDKEIKHEIAVLMLCAGEENIVKLNAVHETRSDTALLLELATGGELQTILDNEECLTEGQARVCMKSVLKALQFLHNRSIAHLDLKPQNILLNGERVEDGLKLCDFGISRVVAEGTNVREIVGTPDYVAPEVLQYEPLSLMTDIWSVGVLAYVLLSGFSPFGGDTKQETFLNISKCNLTFPDKLFEGVSSAAIDFIRRALRIKPSDRMTAAGCLEHHWLKDECSLDRQIFLKPNHVNVNLLDEEETDETGDSDEHSEELEDEDEDEDENDEEDEVQDISIDEEEEIEKLESSKTNGCSKMESSDIEGEYEAKTKSPKSPKTSNNTNPFLNGLMDNSNGFLGSLNSNQKSSGLGNSASPGLGTTKTNTTIATAVLNVSPCSRASSVTTTIPIPIPIFNMQNSDETARQKGNNVEPLHLSAARRQSSDSNKENTFLSTKKISTAPATGNLKMPTTPTTPVTSITTSTATILIGSSSPEKDNVLVANGSTIVATITLPNVTEKTNKNLCCSTTSSSPAQQCNFPDAPTTPKVIRKAPTTDTSPTSVKALVKKFQLEEGNKQQNHQGLCNGEKHLKESHINHQSQHEHQHQQLQQTHLNGHHNHPHQHQQQVVATNGYHNRRPSLNSSSVANDKATSQISSKVQCNGVNGFSNHNHNNNNYNNTQTSLNNKESNVRLCSSINITRRASEPITAVHKKSTTVTAAPRHSVATSNGSGSFKSTCVFGLSCNGRSNNGCTNVTTTLTPNNSSSECRHSSLNSTSKISSTNNGSSNSNASAGGSSSSSSSTASSSSSPSTTAAAAILLSSHQQYHHHHPHHHHHHHGVAKNTTNNLSMDQGIIC